MISKFFTECLYATGLKTRPPEPQPAHRIVVEDEPIGAELATEKRQSLETDLRYWRGIEADAAGIPPVDYSDMTAEENRRQQELATRG